MPDLDTRLDKAITDERKAHSEYTELAQQVTGQDRTTLLEMAADEHRHEQALQRIMAEQKRGAGAARS